MPDSNITFVAHIKAKPGKEAEVRSELEKLIAPTRAEKGCIQYDFHSSMENPGEFLFYEIWKSQKDIDLHFQTEHVTKAFAKLGSLFSEAPKLTRWQKH